jgi:hypothetical protein
MTTYSTEELATRVAKDLGLIDRSAVLDADEMAWLVETIQSELQMLNAKGIPIWNGSDITIPQEYLTALSRRLGLAISPSYGLMDQATATRAIEMAEVNLLRLAQTGPSGAPLVGEYI